MKKKYIFIIIGVITLVLATVLTLVLTKVISMAFFVSSLVIIFISSILIWWVILLKSRKISLEEKTEEIIEVDENYVKNKIIDILFDLNVLEYEKEVFTDGVKHFGYTNTPVYERKSLTLFENKIISILINLKTKETNFEFYDKNINSDDEINQFILVRGNVLSSSPIKRSPKETTLKSELTGVEKIIREEVELEKDKNKEEDTGGLE